MWGKNSKMMGASRADWALGAAAAALALGFAGAASAQTVADAGDSAATQARLNVGQTVSATISPAGDVDWYRVAVRAGQLYEFRLVSDGEGEGALSDPMLVLYNAAGEEIASNDDYGGELNSRIAYAATARGVVYVAARGLSEELTGAYRLTASASALPADDAGDGVQTRARITPGGAVEGRLNYPGDRDAYRVRLEAGQAYRFSLRSIGEGDAALADPMLRLVSPTGEEILSDDDSGGGLNSYIEFAAETAGDYILEARGFGEDAEGGYRLAVAAGDIPADASTDAQLSAEGDFRPGRLTPAGDTDWYRLTLAEGQAVRVSLEGDPEGDGLGDPMLVIYGPDGAELARNDDFGGGLNARVEFAAPAAGDFFVEARGFGDDAEGRYMITLTAGEVGDSAESAEYLAANDAGQSSVIGADGDKDWFSVEVVEARPYRFTLTSDDPESSLDPVLTLRDGEGNELATDDDGGPGVNSYLTFVTPNAGQVFAEVSSYGGAGSGAYTLRVVDTEVPGHAGTDESLSADEEGDDRTSMIDIAGDKDVYRADLVAGASYTISVSGAGDHPLADPFLTILSSEGSELTTDDDSGPGLDARLTFRPTATDNYLIQVTGLGGGVGGYTVSIKRNP